MKLLAKFALDERGVTAIEYGLIASGIALAILVALQATGASLVGAFQRIGTALT